MNSVLITDGGPHSPLTWAEATASQIVDVADSVSGEKRGAAIKLQAAIVDILEKSHTTVQEGERSKIATIGLDRLGHPLDPEDHLSLDAEIAAIVAAASGTAWAEDFAKPEMADGLRVLLTSHLNTNAHIERSWHADRNSGTPEAIAFRAVYHPGV